MVVWWVVVGYSKVLRPVIDSASAKILDNEFQFAAGVQNPAQRSVWKPTYPVPKLK
jgi:hypothetical protein